MPMEVVKRNGRRQAVHFDKITSRISKLVYGLHKDVEAVVVSQKVLMGVYNGVTTVELDELASQTAANMVTKHPDYGILAARIAVSNLHKQTEKAFSATATKLYKHINSVTGKQQPLLDEKIYKVVYERDMDYDYFGFKTLERAYLMRVNGKIVERPQHMLMRVAIGIHGSDMDRVIETYNLMSARMFTHASPTLFNAGTPRPQMSSCFLLTMKEDSIEGIFDTVKRCALISKWSGGIGLSCHKVRASGTYVAGTNGNSNGLTPMLRVFNHVARHVNQGGGKRKGSFAMYLEPWHADIFDFLELRKNHGIEEHRARDLFLGLWVNDLFMQRVEQGGDWSLFCPHLCPGLPDTHGAEFEALYTKYEKEGRALKTIKARTLWTAIMDAQIETGTPYMLYKDACNAKSNQKNLGTIRSSNLCCEIIEYTAPDEVAVCNLASIALPKFISKDEKTGSLVYDHEKLYSVTRTVTRNLNRIIDSNFYPIEEARNSNMRHRPIGIGVQGLADTFIRLRLPFDCEEARQLNKEIFETIYFGALSESVQLAEEEGPYSTYQGSPLSKGVLCHDMWKGVTTTNRWDWAGLRSSLKQHGARNSLLLAPMPTASSSQILGNNECFEPYTSNIYLRRTLSGEFILVNPHLVKDLVKLGIWNDDVKQDIVRANGSVQRVKAIPEKLKKLYRTVWEISQKSLIDMAADRGAFIDQSQSFNVHMNNASHQKLTSMHFYGWKRGLKTGMYYLRTKAAADAIKFTVAKQIKAAEPATAKKEDVFASTKLKEALQVCTMEEGCVSCGS